MNHVNYHTIVLQPKGAYQHYFPAFTANLQYARPEKSLTYNLNRYFLRALAYIQSILRILRSSSPFFEQYGTVIRELPKLYQIMKVMHELKDQNGYKIQDKSDRQSDFTTKRRTLDQSKPLLYI